LKWLSIEILAHNIPMLRRYWCSSQRSFLVLCRYFTQVLSKLGGFCIGVCFSVGVVFFCYFRVVFVVVVWFVGTLFFECVMLIVSVWKGCDLARYP